MGSVQPTFLTMTIRRCGPSRGHSIEENKKMLPIVLSSGSGLPQVKFLPQQNPMWNVTREGHVYEGGYGGPGVHAVGALYPPTWNGGYSYEGEGEGGDHSYLPILITALIG